MPPVSKIRKAVIPAGGLGTEFFPATFASPKEMLPVAGKPLLQYAVEEAAASGIETIILVVGKGKNILAEHFRRNPTVEAALTEQHKVKEVLQIRRLAQLAEIRVVSQKNALGLADAILCARSLILDEPFAVILPEEIIEAAVPCTRQLMSCYDGHGGCVIATQGIKAAEVGQFGIMESVGMPDPCCGDRTQKVTSLIAHATAATTSRYGIFGRYILEPEIFNCIEGLRPNLEGKLKLTDALSVFLQTRPLHAYRFQGKHFSIRNNFDLLKASIAFTLKDPSLAQPLRDYWMGLQQAAAASGH